MRSLPVTLARLLLLATLTVTPPSHAGALAPLAADRPVDGASQLEWSLRWWQWAFSFDRARSPVADQTGEYCASRQAGKVWFLAGTFGSRRTERRCRIPAGSYLFFPLINYVTYRTEGSTERCGLLENEAEQLTDQPQALILAVDGVQFEGLAAHRLASRGCFPLVPGGPADAASNGYYVMLPPLPRGTHTLEFGGVLPTMIQAVTYELEVE